MREAGPIGKEEEGGGVWTGLREASPVEGREEERYGIGLGMMGAGGYWIEVGLMGAGLTGAGPVEEGEKGGGWMATGLREAGLVGEREDRD